MGIGHGHLGGPEIPPIALLAQKPLTEREIITIEGAGSGLVHFDTQLPPGEQIQRGPSSPGSGGTTTTEPGIAPPDWSLVSPETFAMVQKFLTVIGFTTNDTVTAMGPSTHEDELSFIQQAISEIAGEAIPASGQTGPNIYFPSTDTEVAQQLTPSSMATLFDQIRASIASGTKTLSSDYQTIDANMTSSNPADVKSALFELADLSSLHLTPAETTLVGETFSTLSQNIATTTSQGGAAAFFLTLGIPELLTLQLASGAKIEENTALSPENKTMLLSVLSRIAEKFSKVSLAVATQTKPPSAQFQQLTSGNSQQLALLFTNILQPVSIGTMTTGEVSQFIGALASALSPGPLPVGLSSTNAGTVLGSLSSTTQQLGNEGKIAGGDTAVSAIQSVLLPTLAQNIAGINEAKCVNDLYSTNEGVIDSALRNLGGISPFPQVKVSGLLTPAEVAKQFAPRIAQENYLVALVKALAFLAQVRCIISSLEGSMSEALANAKMATMQDEVQAALAEYQTQMQSIQADITQALTEIQKSALLSWLMPLITLIITIIMTIVSIVITVVTAGIGAALMAPLTAVVVAKLTVLCVVVTLTVVMAVISIVDAARAMAGYTTGVWDMLAQDILSIFASGDQPTWLKSLISAVIQVVIAIIITVLTVGAGALLGATKAVSTGLEAAEDIGIKVGDALATIGAKTADDAAEIATQVNAVLWESITQLMVKNAFELIMLIVIQPLLSSGLIMQLCLLIAQACDKTASAETQEIIALIMTIAITLAVTVAGAACSGGGKFGQGIKKALASFGKFLDEFFSRDTFFSIVREAGDAFKRLATFFRSLGPKFLSLKDITLAGFTKAVRSAIDDLLKSIDRTLLLSGVELAEVSALKLAYIFKFFAQLLQIAANAYSAAASFEQAKMKEALASLSVQVAELQASLSFLDQLSSNALDQTATMTDLCSDAKSRTDDWFKLVSLVSSFIEDASKYINALETQGAY